MTDFASFLPYLLVSAGVTYLVRMLPLVLVRKKFENRFIKSFLYYIPYTVLAVMTVPAIFSSTSSTVSGIAGFICALVTAYIGKNLIFVAAASCAAVLVTELILMLF